MMSETRTCDTAGKPFTITDNEIAACERLGVPLPSLCPAERWRALMGTRNEWKLYPRKCDATGKDILSAYPSDSSFTVYENSVWWGDSWDATQYGRDFDFSRPFFEQFAELRHVVPREGTSIFNSENCDYNSHTRESRNCYLNSLVARCEDCLYSYWIVDNKDIVDSLYTYKSTLCYYCSDVLNCYNCIAVHESVDTHDSLFSYQLRGCDHCIFSSNLANKSFYAFNKPCTKEEFEKLRSEAINGSFQNWEQAYSRFLELRQKATHRATHNINCENVLGDHLYNSRNCTNSYEGEGSEDCDNTVSLGASKDIYSSYSAGWPGCENVYFSAVSRGSTNLAFCTYTWFSHGLMYSDSCRSSSDSFGCIGLHRKENCILNKQYSKEDYEALRKRIIGHMEQTGEWGQFFPAAISPFAYNETAAQDFYPLSKDEAVRRGYRWRDPDHKDYQKQTFILPDSLDDTSNDIVNVLLACVTCSKNFRIVPQELSFYRKMNLPLPRSCSTCRHQERMKLRNPHHLWERQCAKCSQNMQTTYAPERPETVYCEQCYLEAVY